MSTYDKDFEQKVALVTGAGSGIGFATVRMMAQRGGRVAMLDVRDQVGRDAQQKLSAEGLETSFHQCDVTSRAAVERTVEDVLKRYGQIDVLVNVVGGSDGVIGTEPAWIWEMSEENWDGMFALNIKSTFLCCRAVVPHMIERRQGSIINFSSGRGAMPAPQRAHYSAAKAGVMALTKTMAAELATHRIRVNSIAPGHTATERGKAAFPAEEWDQYQASQPLGRINEPEDLAEAVCFLAGPHASHITGVILHVNGGTLMV